MKVWWLIILFFLPVGIYAEIGMSQEDGRVKDPDSLNRELRTLKSENLSSVVCHLWEKFNPKIESETNIPKDDSQIEVMGGIASQQIL